VWNYRSLGATASGHCCIGDVIYVCINSIYSYLLCKIVCKHVITGNFPLNIYIYISMCVVVSSRDAHEAVTSHIRSAEQYSIFRYRYRRLDNDKSQSATPTRQHAEKPLIEYQSGESEFKSGFEPMTYMDPKASVLPTAPHEICICR